MNSAILILKILKSIWETFGSMNQWQLRGYTHDECLEWKDPHGSSTPISYKEIFMALGRSDEEATFLQKQIDEQRAINELFETI